MDITHHKSAGAEHVPVVNNWHSLYVRWVEVPTITSNAPLPGLPLDGSTHLGGRSQLPTNRFCLFLFSQISNSGGLPILIPPTQPDDCRLPTNRGTASSPSGASRRPPPPCSAILAAPAARSSGRASSRVSQGRPRLRGGCWDGAERAKGTDGGKSFLRFFSPNSVDTLGVLTVGVKQLMLRSLKRAGVTG